MKQKILILFALLLVILTACDPKNGTKITGVDLPLDNELILYGENVGIHPSTTILEDGNNPYAHANISMDSVWDFHDEAPSPKAKFYLWGTMLAKIPIGEYQYFTARSLHELYTVGGSENAKEQTKKAYRAVLDNFYNGTTWYEAWWMEEETVYAAPLKDLVGQNMYDPTAMNMLSLYNDPVEALQDLSLWGYVYNTETKTISKID
jgi:hypothetical protein